MVSKTIKATVGQKIAYKIIKDGFKTVNGTIDVTSDMDTNVSLETPSTPYTSNIDYSIVENDAFPSIFKLNEDVVLPDDSVLEKNDYLLYPKGEYLVTDDSGKMVYENNFTINGSIKNVGYTFSNFSSSNYLTLQERFNPGNKPWEFVTKFNLTSTSNGYFIGYIGSGLFRVSVWEGKVGIGMSTVTNDWDICDLSSESTISTNTDYWVKAEFTGSAYNLYLSTDGIEYKLEASQESTSIVTFPETTCIGCGGGNRTNLKGSMDLSETYIKIDGEIWWKPQVANVSYNYNINGTCALVRDGVAKGFNTQNYLRLETMPSEITSADLIFKGMTPDLNSHNALIAHINSEQYYGIRYNSNKSFSIYNGSWIDGTNTLSVNTWYWFRVKFDGTNWVGYTLEDKDYTSETLPEISEWRQEWTTPNGFLAGNIFNIGFNPLTADEYWKGSVDLEQSSIIINDEVFWNGTNHQQIGYWDANGVIKGFSTSNYLTLNREFVSNNNATYVLKFTTGDDITTDQVIIQKRYFIDIEISASEGVLFYTWSPSRRTSWFTPEANTTYWIKVVIDGLNRTYSYSTNGIDYSEGITIEDASLSTTDIANLCLGLHSVQFANPFLGSIDLNESYINIDDKLWWQGISKNKFKKGNFKMIGNPTISMNGVVSNFSDYNYIQFLYVGNNETEIFTTFTTGADISNMGNVITFLGGGEIYIRDSVIQTWNIETATDITLTSILPNTMYSLRMKMNPNGRTITIYDANNTIIVEQTINDSGATFNNNSIVNFGFYNANSTSRYWRGSIDLANTYVIINDVKYNMLENDGRYLQGIFDESFVDNYNQEQVVKLYHTMSKNNGLTITNDKVNDGNVLYSQYIDNVTIPPRTTQFTYNIDNESWEIV